LPLNLISTGSISYSRGVQSGSGEFN